MIHLWIKDHPRVLKILLRRALCTLPRHYFKHLRPHQRHRTRHTKPSKMSLLSPRSAWSFIAVLTLLPVSSIYALPIRELATATEIQPATNIQPRDPVRYNHTLQQRNSNKETETYP
jgi:hypothetical protein